MNNNNLFKSCMNGETDYYCYTCVTIKQLKKMANNVKLTSKYPPD